MSNIHFRFPLNKNIPVQRDTSKESKVYSIYYFTGFRYKYNNTLSRPCFIDREALTRSIQMYL